MRHELVHLGAALGGQCDNYLHEIAVQAATTPENLVFATGVIVVIVLGGVTVMRGQAMLVLGVLFSATVGAASILLLKAATDLSGGTVFSISMVMVFLSVMLFGYVVTKLGM